MKLLNRWWMALLFLWVIWILPPITHTIRRLCPTRPDGVNEAQAVSQFTRKYGISCTACHSSFPRLTPFAERFKANGFQMPDTEDGDDTADRSGDRLVMPQLGNIFGARIAMNFAKVKTNDIDKDGDGKKETTSVTPGVVDWLQFFTAGSVYKNVSIFIETEINANTDDKVKNNWYYLGWHNILGKNGALSARMGNIPQADWHVMSGRLRMIPNIGISANGLKSSPGAASPDDQVSVSGAYPGFEFFGLPEITKRVEGVYTFGLTSGKKTSVNPNPDLNYHGVLGLRAKDGDFDGSQISLFGKFGKDSDATGGTRVGPYAYNSFYRLSPGVNLRWKGLDSILAYYYGEDKNATLSLTTPVKMVSRGLAGQIGYNISPAWWGGIQYDWAHVADANATAAAIDDHSISPTIWFFPRDNMRLGAVAKIDVQGEGTGHAQKQHEFLFHLRSMF